MKWFVYVAAEYYAETHIVEVDTAEAAAAVALDMTHGATYARYDDEGTPIQPSPYAIRKKPYRDGHATPACAVVPFSDVIFVGTENRVRALCEAEPSWDDA